MLGIKPFWNYYGGKWRAAPRYPTPRHKHIIEPFAGAAGYSLRYPDYDVTLLDVYPVIAGVWRYLIATPAGEIMRIPCVESVDDLPAWVPQEARWLVGFCMNTGVASPCKILSRRNRYMRDIGRAVWGWSPGRRDLIARQVERIKHWRVIEGDYAKAPDVTATWFIDPPYNNRAGSCYKHKLSDYEALGAWCKTRAGQVIVCENDGATWLPFRPFMNLTQSINGKTSTEAIWTND